VLDEMGPSYVQAGGGARLYFSRSRTAAQGGAVPGDIFVSRRGGAGGTFGPADLVPELSDPVANDIQPNVRKGGREVVFSSNRAGGQGSQDIWVATRENGGEAWSQPVNLANVGDASQQVNTSASETRPPLSWHGETLYFGRAPAAGGPGDVYVTTRERNSH
jgi:OmpA-OmpF porin, OOP family